MSLPANADVEQELQHHLANLEQIAANNFNQNLTGRIYELRIYDRALSATEIQTLYNNPPTPYPGTILLQENFTGATLHLTDGRYSPSGRFSYLTPAPSPIRVPGQTAVSPPGQPHSLPIYIKNKQASTRH